MSSQPLDFARSDNPLLDRLLRAAGAQLFGEVDLSLDRIERQLKRMASPHEKLPPVFHVAGTNGKGSTVAFLRAGLEAAGYRVHVFTSPHLVRVNERIRLAGQLVTDEEFIEALSEVLRFSAGQPLSFFEALTAAAMLLFAATPADATILEVGLGGRLDATNVVKRPLMTGIATLALDHVKILGPTVRHIAAEKAGIAKRDVPLVTQKYPVAIAAAVAEAAIPRGARLLARGDAWDAEIIDGQLAVRPPSAEEPVLLPLPKLPGRHQLDNAALAVAMLRAQDQLPVPDSALRSAMGWAQWPARLQKLPAGPLVEALPEGSEIIVDGGHNPSAAKAVAAWVAGMTDGRPLHVVLGMLTTKDQLTFIRCFPRGTAMTMVPIDGHQCHPPAALAAAANAAGMHAIAADSLSAAMTTITRPTRVLVVGSLYLAGLALQLNHSAPY